MQSGQIVVRIVGFCMMFKPIADQTSSAGEIQIEVSLEVEENKATEARSKARSKARQYRSVDNGWEEVKSGLEQ
jgi:hypothetical protein